MYVDCIAPLIKNTRSLIKEEIIHKMYPVKVMNTLNEDIGLEDFSINEFISSHIQEATEHVALVTRLDDSDRTSYHRVSSSQSVF